MLLRYLLCGAILSTSSRGTIVTGSHLPKDVSDSMDCETGHFSTSKIYVLREQKHALSSDILFSSQKICRWKVWDCEIPYIIVGCNSFCQFLAINILTSFCIVGSASFEILISADSLALERSIPCVHLIRLLFDMNCS